MGFPSVLERIAKALGLYPKNDPNIRNVPHGTGYKQQAGQAVEPPMQEDAGYSQGYGRGTASRVGAKPPQESWQSQYEAAPPAQGYYGQGSQDRSQPAQTGAYRPDNIVRMPDRDSRDYYGRDSYSRDAYMREPSNHDTYGRDAYGDDSYRHDPYGREAYRKDPYGRDMYPSQEPPSQMSNAPSTIIFCVRRKDDSSEIINYLLAGLNVILNFEDVDDVQCQRVLDFVGGAAFALEGSVERISYRNYFVAPRGAAVVRSESQMRNVRENASVSYMSRY